MTVPGCDLVVIGAGPAGAEAAIAASACGLDVVLLDEAEAAGGQVWRAPFAGGPGDSREGAALRARLAASPVRRMFGHRVWSVTERFRVEAVGPDGPVGFAAPRLIAATGATERVLPFPGWTLPGVVGLAATTILLKSHRALPGRRVLVAGCGPLLWAVAAGIAKAGGQVVAVVDRARAVDWLRLAPPMLSRPGLLAQGLSWLAVIARAGIPVLRGHAIRSASGGERVHEVEVGPVGPDGAPAEGPTRRFAADAVCVGDGLVPGGEVPRLLRAASRFDRTLGGWVPQVDPQGRTDVPGLFAIGDGAGIRGAAPAMTAGRIAGLAAGRDAGRLPEAAYRRELAREEARRARQLAFAQAVAGMMALRPAQALAVAPATVVCRCEDVTRAEIDAAIDAGAREMNQVKAFTRCGMGPCQGRICGDVAAEIVAARVGGRERAGHWTVRTPLRPVALADLVGEFDYGDIPIPQPAPL